MIMNGHKERTYFRPLGALEISELDIVNEHGGLIPLPSPLPVTTGLPEILGCMRRVIAPGFSRTVVMISVGEETFGPTYSHVEDHVELPK